MVSLKSGVLLKLLEDIKTGQDFPEEERKPVLLQIRSIVPVLEEGDLRPNRGFFLNVSDMSHALYVSLPQEDNEMILGNRLQLGQLIYVQKLEQGHPVPLLRGITPVPGRRLCEGTPEDIVTSVNLVKIFEEPSGDSIVEKGVILEKKISEKPSERKKSSNGLLSDTESFGHGNDALGKNCRRMVRSLSTSKARPSKSKSEQCSLGMPNVEKRSCKTVLSKSRPSSVDNDSDSDSAVSSISGKSSRRRSWNASEFLGVKEILDSSVVKHGNKRVVVPMQASPVRSVRCYSSDENSSSTSRIRDAASAKKSVRSSNKSPNSTAKANNVEMSNSLCPLVSNRKWAEAQISWDFLPSNLVKIGKEVIKQRDVALAAAADALHEACAAERLLNSLSILSELQMAEGDNLQSCVDKFFDFQDDLAHTKLIMDSLTSISPFKASENEPSRSIISIKDALDIALERKKNAAMWIKSAVTLDLSPCPAAHNTISSKMSPTKTVKKSTTLNGSAKPKGACIIKKRRSSEISLILTPDKDDQPEWSKGSTLIATNDLATSLHVESSKLFLTYVEKYLDEVERKASSKRCDSKIAGMMCNVKRINDRLDVIANKEANTQRDGSGGDSQFEDSEIEACTRIRNKIYSILLKLVERTAVAFER